MPKSRRHRYDDVGNHSFLNTNPSNFGAIPSEMYVQPAYCQPQLYAHWPPINMQFAQQPIYVVQQSTPTIIHKEYSVVVNGVEIGVPSPVKTVTIEGRTVIIRSWTNGIKWRATVPF